MSQTILLNFATRSRPAKFFQCIKNIEEMTVSDNYLICVKADRNDPSMNTPEIRSFLADHPHIIAEWGISYGKIHAINRNIPKDGWDILINMSDDVRWTVKGFDNIIRKDMETDTFLHYPEPFADNQCALQNVPPISVVSIMDKIYYDRFLYVYHSSYKSLWCDNEATEVARRLGRHKWVDQIIFSHDHPQAGKGQMDSQYRRTEAYYHEDQKTYNKRKAKGFPA
jgi:hypothetical protein